MYGQKCSHLVMAQLEETEGGAGEPVGTGEDIECLKVTNGQKCCVPVVFLVPVPVASG